mmetsp:Transcript_21899/g.86936  ORF Transcript_21899/g.86936 Transcript_21899/m.86936 type:complete len:317 (-) Transcript_21899:65-1015(-)
MAKHLVGAWVLLCGGGVVVPGARSLTMRADAPGVYVRLAPLVGGPAALPVHSQCFVDDASSDQLIGFDMLPRDATSPATIRRLLALQSAPGVVRELRRPANGRRRPRDDDDDLMFRVGALVEPIDALRECATAESGALHLVANPCWRHTLRVAAFATGRATTDLALDVARALLSRGLRRLGRLLLGSGAAAVPVANAAGDALTVSSALMAKSAAEGDTSSASEEEEDLPAASSPEDPSSSSSSASEEDATSGADVARLFAKEKARRFGVDLADLLSDEDRLQAARAATEFEEALRVAKEEAARARERGDAPDPSDD